MASAKVCGGGVGAICCAALLRRKGWNVTLCLPPKTKSPTVMLNAVTIQIIRDIFGNVKHLLKDAQPISRHYINWSGNSSDEFTPSSAFTLAGTALSARMLDLLRQDEHVAVSDGTQDETSDGSFDWHVYAMNEQLANNDIPVRRFGQRYAISVQATLHDHNDGATSLLESTPAGWLFLTPFAQGQAVLQAVVPERPKHATQSVSDLLARTKEIKRLVRGLADRSYTVECAPKKISRLAGAHWLATGTAACSYDPLCGDGSGYAIRAAILAAAVLDGIDRGMTKEGLLTYYKLRLTYAFYSHLRACLSLYSTARFDESWRAELSMMEEGLREVEQELSNTSTYHYRLNGFELLPA